MTTGVSIDGFREPDWPAVWHIVRTVCAAGDTYVYPPDIDEALARRLWLQPSPSHTIVARDVRGAVLGTAKMGPNHMGPGAHVANASFMVDPAARGLGVGRALGSYAIEWAARAGYRGM